MKQFNIYTNDNNEYEVIKIGWSWPAFFFNWIWGIIKKLYKTVAGSFLLIAIVASIMGLSGVKENIVDIVLQIGAWSISIIFGLSGNQWRERNVTQRGYKLQKTVNASNVNEALNIYTDNKAAANNLMERNAE